MATRHRQRDVRFEATDGYLVRTVTFPAADGRTYAHRCPLATYELVAHAADETPTQGEGITLEPLARALDVPFTQVNVALEFLKERGVLVTRHRRSYRASATAFEDAMCEFHALREEVVDRE
jgi:hypothetical protein